jgi:uncharacterized protein (DUF2147 family)
MPVRPLILSAALLMVVTPALAAEYYVGKNAETGKCSVVEEKPDGTAVVMVGTESYATEKEAKAAKKADAQCKKAKKKKDDSAN